MWCLLVLLHFCVRAFRLFSYLFVFFFNDTATTEIYTLSLHDALPISCGRRSKCCRTRSRNPTRSPPDRKSTRLNSSHVAISYAVFCLKKKKTQAVIDWRGNIKVRCEVRKRLCELM